MDSSFPNRWSFSYLKFTKYITNIIAEPKYKHGQQEQVTVKNHNRSTALERSEPADDVTWLRIKQPGTYTLQFYLTRDRRDSSFSFELHTRDEIIHFSGHN